ncbi:MAG TPA: RHS repeat-associated core domain-containing protein, partial [Anaerolineae bacterium]|nr:RHS repeat-associated core domain-containing protein [Anaerolineae bacterium]
FTRDGEVWTGEDEFYPANRDNLDTFGWDVALEGDTVFVGAPLHDIGMVTDTGSVYLFTREADETWTEVMAVTADDSDSNDQFGLSVALAGGHHLIGAPLDDEVGVDGGAAYWFQPGVQTTVTYTYDPLYRVVGAVYTGSVDAEFDYLYDAVGNLTVYTETITSTQVTTRTVNERNQLVLTNQGGVTTSYSYDQNGNLTNIRPAGIVTSGAKIYGYDQRNLMVTATVYVTNSYAAVADYHYDGNRTRLQQVVYSGTTPITTTYIQDLQGLAQVLVAEGSAETNYYLMGHARIAQDNGSQVRYFLADGLGSVRVEMVGSTIDTFSTYEPYGDLLHQTGSSDSVYGFAGEEYDVGTGLVYLRARYYSPELMQFMGRDGYAGQPRMPVTMHGYSYAHSNPVNLVDPSGYSPSNLLRGVIIHKMIQIEYLERYPNADIEVSIPGASVHGQYRIKKFCDSITGVSYWSLVCGWTPGMSAITNNTGRADIIKDLELFEIKPRPARDIGAITAMWYIYAYADAYNIQLTLGTSYGSKRLIGPDPMNPSKFIMAEQDVPGVITYWDVNAPTAPPPTGYVYAYNHATRRIEKKAWQFQMASNMVPQLQPVRNSGLVQVCGAAVILAGGVIIVSTLVTDIISLGAGVIDDPATITAGSTLIATGNKMMQSGAIP